MPSLESCDKVSEIKDKMKVVYLRGKNPKILDNCGHNSKYDSYYRSLARHDGVEWLSNIKVLGIIEPNGLYSPSFPHLITPTYQKHVAKLLGLKIEMNRCDLYFDNKLSKGKGNKLYYYNGEYHQAKKLFS